MRQFRKLLQWAAVLALVATFAWVPAAPAAGAAPGDLQESQVRLRSSTTDGVAFEVDVPWEGLIVEPVSTEGKAYVRVSLPGWAVTSQGGAPVLPFLSEAIGVPFDAGLTLLVEPGSAHTITLPAPVLPAATQVVEYDTPGAKEGIPELRAPIFITEQDPAIYARNAAYPGVLAELTGDGVIRQQRVAGIAAYPVQYNPRTEELTVYKSLRVTVEFGGQRSAINAQLPGGSGQQAAESAYYENALQQLLLNHETARAWRQDLTPSTTLKTSPGSSLPSAGTEQLPPGGREEDLSSATLGAEMEGGLPWAAPDPGWRVKVREEGFYRLTYAELLGAGLPVNTSLSTSTFQLFNLGSEVAIQVSDADEDGVFDVEDSLLFYGQAVDSKYTADNVYWLTYGQGTGLRTGLRDGTPGTGEPRAYYPARRHLEENAVYFTRTSGDDDLERYMWGYVYPPDRPSWSRIFALAAPYASDSAATLTVAMFGYLDNAINPDHHAQTYLNDMLLGDVWWDGITWQVAQFDIPQGLLVAGDNALEIVAPNDSGVGYDVIYIDWAELAFANTFLAEGDVLAFGYETTGTSKFQVDGFSTDGLAVYDVTDPAAVVRLEGIDVIGSGPYSAVFEDTLSAPTRYWATSSSAYRTVQAIEQDTPSNLASTSNGADHIVITHQNFAAQAAQLRDFRALKGLRAMSVNVQDVYDEFGYGLVGAAAIHDFLAYAYGSWQAPAPSFVVLLGDGHFDPKDYLGFGRVSYVPPYLAAADPYLGETAADNRYVTLVGDDTLPDMMLGRLAVNSSAEASAIVDKIMSYEGSSGDWQQQVLAVADNADSGGNFAQLSEALLSGYLPAPYQAERVYYGVTHVTVADARAAIQNGINAGKLIVNYIGHGGISIWAGEGLLKTSDVPLLQNGGKYPVVLAMTCYEGSYHYPTPPAMGYDALAEVVTRAGGRGAVASWSPTGEGVSSAHQHLDQGFFQALFTDPGGLVTLGQATTAGKLNLWATGSNLYLLDTYLLFGDPATEIALPEAGSSADLQVDKTASPAAPVAPGELLEYTITFANNGPDAATGVVLGDPMPAGLIDPQVVNSSDGLTLRAGTTFEWDIQDLAAGSSGWVTVRGTVDPALVPPVTIVNTAQISAAETDPVPANNSASASTEVQGSSPVGTLHVADLDGFKSSENKKFWWASVSALILDQDGNAVPNATVSGEWSGGASGTSSCVTDSAGLCTSTSDKVPASTSSVTFTVTGVAHDSLTYDPADNQDPDGDSDGTTIVVYRDGPPPNQPPVASFTYECMDLTCSFTASASDPDGGTIVSYSWDFGDGETGTGAVASHPYLAADTYTVVLTVADDGGAVGSETQTVPVGVEPGVMYVADIAMSGGTAGANRFATVVVTIVDTTGNPVEGATVYGDWSGDYSASVQGTTGADGTVTFTSGKAKVKNATFTFTVSDVVKAGFTYDPGQNGETSDTITVP